MERHGIVLGLCFSAIATLVGCKREPPPPPPPPPPPAPAAAPEPAKPVAPVYAPDKAAELLKQFEGCENDFNCDAYKPLVSFGDKVSMQLAAIATDSTKKGQKVAIQALGEIKDPRVGRRKTSWCARRWPRQRASLETRTCSRQPRSSTPRRCPPTTRRS